MPWGDLGVPQPHFGRLFGGSKSAQNLGKSNAKKGVVFRWTFFKIWSDFGVFFEHKSDHVAIPVRELQKRADMRVDCAWRSEIKVQHPQDQCETAQKSIQNHASKT